MDADLALAIARAYKLNLRAFELIQKTKSLAAAKIPGLRTKRELYQCYQKFGNALWAEVTDYARDNMSVPDPYENQRAYQKNLPPRPKPNAFHFIASLNGADQVKQLSDIGALIVTWFLEDLSWFVMEDYENNKDDPENAQFEPLWGIVPEVETMHTMGGYNEGTALIRKLNDRLSEA